ncbi:hypothetical protein [Arthrobacter koreensis]|uniref:hypothetical protein n=1 Tax=Arthrobacter koreensis TaxID=199136 RepID=UPI002DBA446D|nr:hypothetical protein [Arthrobacter koreensis]MEB7504071.1 hypothetical protein [Arthrobacter koreensis]
MAANLVFLLLIYPVYALAGLNQDISEFNGSEAGGGWLLLWPGMLIMWGVAWLGFAVFALRGRLRSALTAFNAVAALWFIPVTVYVLSLFAGA